MYVMLCYLIVVRVMIVMIECECECVCVVGKNGWRWVMGLISDSCVSGVVSC